MSSRVQRMLRLPAELNDRLKAQASTEELSQNALAVKAIEHYLRWVEIAAPSPNSDPYDLRRQ